MIKNRQKKGANLSATSGKRCSIALLRQMVQIKRDENLPDAVFLVNRTAHFKPKPGAGMSSRPMTFEKDLTGLILRSKPYRG